MNKPVEPMDKKIYYFVRIFRYVWLLVVMIPIGYIFFTNNMLWGFGLTILGFIFWLNEIRRGNGTEDYIMENYENPLR